MLLEQELIERADIENLVCPVLVDLTAPDSNDDVKTEAMAVSLATRHSDPMTRFQAFLFNTNVLKTDHLQNGTHGGEGYYRAPLPSTLL